MIKTLIQQRFARSRVKLAHDTIEALPELFRELARLEIAGRGIDISTSQQKGLVRNVMEKDVLGQGVAAHLSHDDFEQLRRKGITQKALRKEGFLKMNLLDANAVIMVARDYPALFPGGEGIGKV